MYFLFLFCSQGRIGFERTEPRRAYCCLVYVLIVRNDLNLCYDDKIYSIAKGVITASMFMEEYLKLL